jgi:hypothetical protein
MRRVTLSAAAICSGLLLPLLAGAGVARAQSAAELDPELDTVARVVSSTSELRAGPGLSYRVIERAERGDAFFVQGRESTGHWLRVYLADGRTAYLLGDTADTMLATDAGGEGVGAPGVFSPPPLGSSRGGLAMTGGVFDGSGYAELKPALVLTRALALEPYVGLVMSAAGRSLLYGGGATVNLAPDWALAPFVSLGAGGYSTMPNDDAFLLRKQSLFHARAGGGLLVSLRWRITLRLEANNTVLFDASAYQNALSFVGGLGSYF